MAIFVLLAAIGLAMAPSRPEIHLTHISERFDQVDWSKLPTSEFLQARDGEQIAYRRYTGDPKQIVLALHGSGGAGNALHPLAQALNENGYTVIVPDIRGHGASGRRGDVDYIGQVQDDLDDLRKALPEFAGAENAHLLGFSMGGGIALSYGAASNNFDSVTLLSPYLAHDAAPMADKNPYAPEVPWATPSIPRIISLSTLNSFGITAFNHLPVVALATDPNDDGATVPAYTFRMMQSVNPTDWATDLASTKAPLTIVVGAEDELHGAPGYQGLSDVNVQVVPGVDHMGITLADAGIAAAVSALKGQ
ncbi:MAG: alpha/beta hydrolase [Pikeienuella sp.]